MPRIAPQLTPAKHRRPAGTSLGLEHLAASTVRISDRAALADIETAAARVGDPHERCYDVRPMLDIRERSPQSVDIASEHIAYAITRGLVVPSEGAPWLVRVVGAR